MSTKKVIVAGLAVGACTVAMAQDYFDFGQIPGVPDRPAIQVDLSPTLLGIASETARADNPAAAELLSSIEGVRVRVYRSLENIDDVIEFVDDISAELERDDWEQVVRVQDDDNVRIYVRGDEETITGLTAMVVSDDGEAVFVNIAGTISGQLLAQSMAHLHGIDAGQVFASLDHLDFDGRD